MMEAISVSGTVASILLFGWFAFRSVRTGMIAGDPASDPRRDERPVQFWGLVLLFLFVAVTGVLRLSDRL